MSESQVNQHLSADRLCRQCRFNLFAQPIEIEPHYNLAIARCPQCSAANAVDMYPQLSVWGHRWLRVLAALWFLVLATLALAGGVLLFGLAMGLSLDLFDQMARAQRNEYGSVFQVEEQYEYLGSGMELTYTGEGTATAPPFDEWIENRSLGELFAASGGVNHSIDKDAVIGMVVLWLCCGPYGLFWACALLGLRGRGRLVFCAVHLGGSFALAMLIFVLVIAAETDVARNAMAVRLSLPMFVAASLICSALVVAGVMWGRTLARYLLTVLLPPPLRAPLGFFWRCDGLSVPISRRTYRR